MTCRSFLQPGDRPQILCAASCRESKARDFGGIDAPARCFPGGVREIHASKQAKAGTYVKHSHGLFSKPPNTPHEWKARNLPPRFGAWCCGGCDGMEGRCGWPVSRVLSRPRAGMAIHLGPRSPAASCGQPGGRAGGGSAGLGPHGPPMRPCSRWGLPCRRRCRRRGALLPHRFTLAGADAPAVCSLWRFPWGRACPLPRRALPGTVPPWSPDFPHPGRARARPSGHPPDRARQPAPPGQAPRASAASASIRREPPPQPGPPAPRAEPLGEGAPDRLELPASHPPSAAIG